jgi:hypothetical protein
MGKTETICKQINEALPNIKSGTLRFWGEWFGRPYDNIHTLVRCECAHDVLRLYFYESEILSVWNPKALTVNRETFQIMDADRVRWEWFSYGRPKITANLYFQEFVNSPEGILKSTNFDGYQPDFKPISTMAAVEML